MPMFTLQFIGALALLALGLFLGKIAWDKLAGHSGSQLIEDDWTPVLIWGGAATIICIAAIVWAVVAFNKLP